MDPPFLQYKIQPVISTIQPNVPTALDAALEEIKKLQAEKNDAVKQLKNQNLAFEKTKADLIYAQENTIKIFQQMGYTGSY